MKKNNIYSDDGHNVPASLHEFLLRKNLLCIYFCCNNFIVMCKMSEI